MLVAIRSYFNEAEAASDILKIIKEREQLKSSVPGVSREVCARFPPSAWLGVSDTK